MKIECSVMQIEEEGKRTLLNTSIQPDSYKCKLTAAKKIRKYFIEND